MASVRRRKRAPWVEQLPANPLEFSNADCMVGAIVIDVIRRINDSIQALAADRIHPSHGYDTALYGELLALAALDTVADNRAAPDQIEQWRAAYEAWFTRRRFRSPKATAHRSSVNMLLDRLRQNARPLPRSMWITDGWRAKRPDSTTSPRSAPPTPASRAPRSPTLTACDDGRHGLHMNTDEDTGYLWHKMIDYVGRREQIAGFDTLAFDPEAGMFSVTAPDRGVVEAVAEIIGRLERDPALRAEAIERGDDDLL